MPDNALLESSCSVDEIAASYKTIIEKIGEDATREGLVKTPMRAAKAMQYLTSGYSMNLKAIINDAMFDTQLDEMVIVKNIELYSLCEHHLLPFIGQCHIAYMPNKKVIGISKIPRIVDMFAKRLQIQEELNHQIAHCILEVTQAKGVAVTINAKHLCMMMRGVEKQNSSLTTSSLLGCFRSNARMRAEYLDLIKS